MKRAAAPLRMPNLAVNPCFRAAPFILGVLALGGCAAQKKAAIPWTTAVLVRPLVPTAVPAAALEANTPDIAAAIPAPEQLTIAHSSPARPRVPTPPPARENQNDKLEVPQIVPELSAQESSALQQETEQSLNRAEQNIATASRKTLNATQTDLASKIRGFISDAHDAGKVGDWARARDLAKKAQVLSDELVNSF